MTCDISGLQQGTFHSGLVNSQKTVLVLTNQKEPGNLSMFWWVYDPHSLVFILI